VTRRPPPPQTIAAFFVFLAMGGIGFLPLFGGPGYEHALASGLIVPSAAAIATAIDRLRRASTPLANVARGVVSGLGLAAISFATALMHAVRTGPCDLAGGSLTFIMTAGFGAVCGGVWGALVGEAAARRSRPRLIAVLGALAGPLAGIALSVWRFYATPIVYAFDPFFGYFSGTLYDTVIDAGTPLLTYRAGSLAAVCGIALFASILRRDEKGKLATLPWRMQPGVLARAVLAALCGAAALGVLAAAHPLGHWHSSASIAAALGARREGARCTAVLPSGTREDEANLMLQDCEEQLSSVEAALGARGPSRVTAFFFRDAAEKKRLMGAADTYIAKPWRGEVYLQTRGYPHPVLGHELAHVVAGSFGRGPFRVAGEYGGLWPNPGLIEGIAVAASPEDDDLTDVQWARAMMDLGILPSMRTIFGVGFLGENSAKSYTVAGAFVRWAIGRYGPEVVRGWYGGASLEGLTHQSWAELDAAFRQELGKYTLSPEADAVARARFGRPSVFGRVCPHVVDELRQEADRCRDQSQYERAVDLYTQALDKDAHDWASRFGRANVLLRYGDADKGRNQALAIAEDDAAPRTWRDKAEEALADAEFLDGKYERAGARYRALADRTLDEDVMRNLEVKAIGAGEPDARPAIEALLLGARHRPTDILVAAVQLGAWSQASKSALADYLIGKNLAGRGWYVLAAIYLDRALEASLPVASVAREALRQRAVCACAMHDERSIARVKADIDGPSSPFRGTAGGRRASVEQLLSRCLVK
jgi:tetratricopeptide (TPR) repeat protein